VVDRGLWSSRSCGRGREARWENEGEKISGSSGPLVRFEDRMTKEGLEGQGMGFGNIGKELRKRSEKESGKKSLSSWKNAYWH